MFPYYITIILTAVFSDIAQKSRMRELQNFGFMPEKPTSATNILFFLAIIPLIFTAGFRYKVGSDFGAYYKANEVFNGNIWNAFIHFKEPGIAVIVKIVSFFTTSGAAYIFVFSFFTLFFSLRYITQNTDYYFFAIMLFIFTGSWHGTFNGVRQYLAATVLTFSYKYIIERNFIKYAIWVYIAALFHSSAIVMLVLYFVMQNKVSLLSILLLSLGTFVVSKNYDTIFGFISSLKDQEIPVESEYFTRSVNILRVLVNCCPAVACIAIFWGKKLNSKETFLLNGLIINASAMLAASNSAYLSRISIYTNYFVPIGLAELIRFKNPQIRTLVRAIILILYFIFWHTDVSISPALNHFQWTWNA